MIDSAATFINRLKILRSLDRHEVPSLTDAQWAAFRKEPPDFMIIADDRAALAVWCAVLAREKPLMAEFRLTPSRLKILTAATGDLGVIEMPYMAGFERMSWRRNAEALVHAGLMEASPHGDWYITNEGRAALNTERNRP